MALFETGLTDSITKAIDRLGQSTAAATATAIVDGFERAALIIADRLAQIEKSKCKCKRR